MYQRGSVIFSGGYFSDPAYNRSDISDINDKKEVNEMWEKRSCEIRSWENVYKRSKELSDKVKEAEYEPDIVIGLARGGWVPARNLCDFLGIKDLISLKLEHWGVTATPDGEAKIKYPIDIDLTGKKVLVVDDCSDTGESIKETKKFLQKLNPKTVKTATMQIFDTTPKDGIPDFWVERVPWIWIIYPWNITEDLINLTNELIEGGEKNHSENLQKSLKEKFDLTVDTETIEYIMEEAKRRGEMV
ncbi:MAG: phosphoribosyltransferase [Halobacteriota archaeon]|nr:phosphoribosyltransferase [Halobacteriota archaeon]